MRILLFILLAHTYILAAADLNPLCAAYYHAVSENGFDKNAMAATYLKIWDDLGQNATPEILLKVIESKNPFQLPKDFHQNSETLSKTLTEFEELLSQTGIENEEINEILINELKAKVTGQVKIKERQDKVDKTASLPTRIAFDSSTLEPLHFTPDSKHLIFLDPYGRKLWVSEDKKPFIEVSSKLSTNDTEKFFLAKDGIHAFYSLRNSPNQLFRATLFNDKGELLPVWQTELWRDKNGSLNDVLIDLELSANGKWLLSEFGKRVFIQPTEHPIPKKPVLIHKSNKDNIRLMKFIDKTEEILVLGEGKIHFYNYKGKETRPTQELQWHGNKKKGEYDFWFNHDQFGIEPNGKYAYSNYDTKLLELDLNTGKIKRFDITSNTSLKTGKRITDLKFSGFTIDPEGKYGHVLINDSKGKTGTILTVDLKTKKTVKETPSPHNRPHALFWAPNKEFAITTGFDSEFFYLLYREELLP